KHFCQILPQERIWVQHRVIDKASQGLGTLGPCCEVPHNVLEEHGLSEIDAGRCKLRLLGVAGHAIRCLDDNIGKVLRVFRLCWPLGNHRLQSKLKEVPVRIQPTHDPLRDRGNGSAIHWSAEPYRVIYINAQETGTAARTESLTSLPVEIADRCVFPGNSLIALKLLPK